MRELIFRHCDEWEEIVDKETGQILISGHKLDAEDVLYSLGYKFDMEEIKEDE